ncbi:hypothetical protein P879_05675 [Paragonimus westermani]|uniref:Uncharacterized protein n=1 Tax=Paragonimus westermani TaxID=34504 RepID=A0A8T0DSN5_9TREM|nr:hypothetical protein P879_05675 [Paragonimus westermani]
MPIRVPRHVARFLIEKIAVRLKLLETALLELHDIDNRLKMELLSLTSLVDADIENLELDDESDLFAPFTPQDTDTVGHKRTCNFSPYELVDLDDVLVPTEWNEFDSDLFLERSERYANSKDADNQTLKLCTRSSGSASPDRQPGLLRKASQTVNFLAGLINDSSLKMNQIMPYPTGSVGVTVPTCSKRPNDEHETDTSPSKRKVA